MNEMKKAFGLMLFTLILCGSLFAAAPTIEDPLPQPTAAVAATPAQPVIYIQATTAPTAPTANPAVAPAPTSKTDASASTSSQSTWSYIGSNVFIVLEPIIKVLIAALVANLVLVITQHFNIQVSSGEVSILQNAATAAVSKAEAWADAHKDAPSSNAKLNYAIQAMRAIADQPTVKQYTNDELAHYVEEAVYKLFKQPDPNVLIPGQVLSTDPTPTVSPAKAS